MRLASTAAPGGVLYWPGRLLERLPLLRWPGSLLFWDYTGDKVVPNIAKGWEMKDGGRTLVLHLRRGMKWSDGQPFTADDFIFWYEDMYQNRELVPTRRPR